jgi:hypothetical protein
LLVLDSGIIDDNGILEVFALYVTAIKVGDVEDL